MVVHSASSAHTRGQGLDLRDKCWPLHEHGSTGGMQHWPALHMALLGMQGCVLQEKRGAWHDSPGTGCGCELGLVLTDTGRQGARV